MDGGISRGLEEGPESQYQEQLSFRSTSFCSSSPEDMLIDFRERGREGERERKKIDVGEKHDQLPLICALMGDGTCNLGMCPDWELNPRPYSLLDVAPASQPQRPGLMSTVAYLISTSTAS